MKLRPEHLKVIQSCSTADELVEKAQAEGFSITAQEANVLLNGNDFQEINKEELDIAGGGCAIDRSDEICDYCHGKINDEEYEMEFLINGSGHLIYHKRCVEQAHKKNSNLFRF